jgi:hypothetical protein
MLTLVKCRDIVGETAPKNETELEGIREHLYSLARVVLEQFPPRKERSCDRAIFKPKDDKSPNLKAV